MNCSEVDKLLNAYVDEDLSEASRQALAQHLDRCRDCRSELEALQSLRTAARELPHEIEPGSDLWSAIESRLASARSVRPETSRLVTRDRYPWLRLAAAVLTLLVLAVPVSVWWTGRADEPAVSRSVSPPATDPSDADLFAARAAMARSEDGVLLARTDLLAVIERQRDVLADDTLHVLEENMYLLDRAIGEIRQALEMDPQNRRLRLLLAARYQQERRLLLKASRV